MINRGGFSFVAMLVINPVVILFYQNCSMAPVSQAKNSPPPIAIRQVASEAKPVIAKIKPACEENKKDCAAAE
ncbi:hypothetical protein [Bdellovibrio svalbardensis]|uniref:Uncharacterized protein n=1 Tax=Bdellovibrio svalbardensis TaxID=2972972 RepID=A0ABT6DEJ7_9BACT|nr:hypothetical protein [Bdellovibrio svalbardensis]MDG0815264.1 hypothetical protein [Bdellovibrio svalbardensis]